MSEAEVSLRLAFWLDATALAASPIDVAIDGAQVQVGGMEIFPISTFLSEHGWHHDGGRSEWRGTYHSRSGSGAINIHSTPGLGDVVVRLTSGKDLRVEAKRGPLERSKSSAEYPLVREALGQLLTVAQVGNADILAIAVPHSPKFAELAERWRHAPLITRFGIRILTVDRGGTVHGLEDGTA